MKFFIDTADISEIRDAHAMGMVDGVTTNPSLIAKTGRRFEDVLQDICAIVDGPISAEAVAESAADLWPMACGCLRFTPTSSSSSPSRARASRPAASSPTGASVPM